MPTPYDAMRDLLSDRPIAFHPMMARLLGGINEALFFQQIAYWSDKGADPEWIFKTQADLERETALTRTQQENARKTLRRLGVIEEDKRGLPAKLFYRVNWSAVFDLIEGHKDAGNLQTRMRETVRLDRGKAADLRAGEPQSFDTESTSEISGERDRSKGTQPTPMIPARERRTIESFAEDYARELRDEAKLPSTVTRLVNLYVASSLDLDTFIDTMQLARALTQKHSAGIRKEAADGSGRKAKMSYYLATLEDQLDKRRGVG